MIQQKVSDSLNIMIQQTQPVVHYNLNTKLLQE